MARKLATAVLGCCLAAAACGPGSAGPAGTTTPAPASATGSPSRGPSPAASASESPAESASASATPGPMSEAELTWTPLGVPASGPPAREDHTWTVDRGGAAGWLFGGRDGGTVFDDLWRYDFATDAWTAAAPAGDGPDGRFGHTATWVDGVGLVVWSGQAGATFFDDLWAWDPAASAWRELSAAGPVPAARYGSCAALGPDGRLWISHGFTEDSGRFADTQAYDFTANRWTDETPDGTVAPIRCLHDCLWTPDGQLVLYAGQTTGTPAIGDLWTRGVTEGWSPGPDGPAPRQLYGLASVDGTAFVFGGGAQDGGTLRDLWLLDLATLAWTPAATTGDQPSGRSGAALVADPDGSRLLMFGGKRGGEALGDVWELAIER